MADVQTDKRGIGDRLREVPAFINQVKAETDKVVWPSRRETVMTAVMVVIMTTVLGLFFFGVDALFSEIVRFLLKLA